MCKNQTLIAPRKLQTLQVNRQPRTKPFPHYPEKLFPDHSFTRCLSRPQTSPLTFMPHPQTHARGDGDPRTVTSHSRGTNTFSAFDTITTTYELEVGTG